MFENLSNRLQDVTRKLLGQNKLSEKNIEDVLREIRVAFLEADVDYKVTKDFVDAIKVKALGQEVLVSVTPAQLVMKYVADEITHLLGDNISRIKFSDNAPTIIMMAGLQGTGKTTTTAKLALHLTKEGHRPLMVGLDIYRPAAQEQLKVLGASCNIPVYLEDSKNCLNIAKNSLKYARENNCDCVLLDTAGRLHIDEEMMNELKELKSGISPHEILLVVDSMTGQQAVAVAKEFNSLLGIDGVILTKLDGDARGGAALSLRTVVQRPIKFVGVGEKLEDLDSFYPDRMASRIIGMGDIFTLAEKVEKIYSEDEAKKLESKIRKNEFTLEDMKDQFKNMKKLGAMEQVVKLIPGLGSKINIGEAEKNNMKSMEAILSSMTKMERLTPRLLNGSRRMRIANGSGTTVQQVNQLMNRFDQMKKMMKQFGGANKFDMNKLKAMGGKFK
ncbi:MAG: signal recognition particle protein [bacterium]|nr:signal recognition particle protein [bacterium]